MGRSCRWRLSFVFLQQEHDTFKEFSFLKPFPTHGAFLSKDNCQYWTAQWPHKWSGGTRVQENSPQHANQAQTNHAMGLNGSPQQACPVDGNVLKVKVKGEKIIPEPWARSTDLQSEEHLPALVGRAGEKFTRHLRGAPTLGQSTESHANCP